MKIRRTAGGVVFGPEGKIAVVNQFHNSWSLPKGGIDGSENTIEAARREIREETGLKDLEFVSELGSYRRHRIPLDEGPEDKREIKEITMFLFKTGQKELAPEDPDNPEARWVDVDDVADLLTHDKDKEFLNSVISKIRQHL